MSAYRPVAQHQGPANHCIIAGRLCGWTSCTSYSVSMGIDATTFGGHQPTGCHLRAATGDTSGGTTLRQNTAVADRLYGVRFEVHVGRLVCTPAYAGSKLKAGRGFVLQGNTGALLGTVHQSTNGPVNHAVWVNEGKGFDGSIPEAGLVFDPAADARRPGVASAPEWWSWALLLKFAAALRPNGDDDPYVLGPGRFYCAIAPTHTVRWGDDTPADFRNAYTAEKVAAKLRSLGVDTFGAAINMSDLEAGLRARGIDFATSVQLVDLRALMKVGKGKA